MLRVIVEQLDDTTIRVKIEGDEPQARVELSNELREAFAPHAEPGACGFTWDFGHGETAARVARTLKTVWGGDLVRVLGDGETHIKRLLFNALDAWFREHPNTHHINKISPIQVAFSEGENIRGLMTARDELTVTGEYDQDVGWRKFHYVGEYIDGGWSWHLDTEGRIA